MAILTNLLKIKSQIAACAAQSDRNPHSIQLLAVSKGQPLSKIIEAYEAGQTAFGENYFQEAIKKISALSDKEIEWHFVGQIQSNKTRKIAENFSWVHSVHDIKIAKRLHAQRPSHLPPLNICLQVDMTHNESKTGVTCAELKLLAEQCLSLPHLQLRGLMVIADQDTDAAKQRHYFHSAYEAWQQLRAQGFMLDTLSMGMSGDFEAAIAEGSTLVRIGTAIFGARD